MRGFAALFVCSFGRPQSAAVLGVDVSVYFMQERSSRVHSYSVVCAVRVKTGGTGKKGDSPPTAAADDDCMSRLGAPLQRQYSLLLEVGHGHVLSLLPYVTWSEVS